MTTKGDPGFWRYTWDFENRLGSASRGKQSVRYKYDALGRRVQRYLVGNLENTKFIYEGQDVLADDNAGTLTKYLNGPGIDNKLRQTTGSSVSYFVSDHLGSTNGLTNAAGALTASNSYDSFGNPSNAGFPSRYQFTGREFDNFTGLQYSRARFYDPNLGRFISEDPIGFNGGDVNLYGYVWSNPNNFYDPLGLDGWGNDAADALDGYINYSRGFYKADPQHWVYNGTVDTVADLTSLAVDPLRTGSGVGDAIYNPNLTPDQRVLAVANDVLRATAIASIIGGGASRALRVVVRFIGPAGEEIEFCPLGKFPTNPDDFLPELPRDPKGRIYPSDNIRIRPEQHAPEPGDVFNARHHGQHYHVDTKIDPNRGWRNNNINKVKPPGYVPGSGTGFMPGEQFPGW